MRSVLLVEEYTKLYYLYYIICIKYCFGGVLSNALATSVEDIVFVLQSGKTYRLGGVVFNVLAPNMEDCDFVLQ